MFKGVIPQIVKLRGVVDEYRLWVNTNDVEDIEFMKCVEATYPDFIKLEYLTVPYEGNGSIYSFFKNCQEDNTVYVRFDDDIVYLDDMDRFKEFLKFRIDHPEFFLVYGNILNNAIISHIHQRMMKLDINHGVSGYMCSDFIGWTNPIFAESIHRCVLSNIRDNENLEHFHMPNWLLFFYERCSINCISWLGSEFALFNAEVGPDEEQWLSCDKPASIKKMNCIFGRFCCVHYAFGPQRHYIDSTDILNQYRDIVAKKMNITF